MKSADDIRAEARAIRERAAVMAQERAQLASKAVTSKISMRGKLDGAKAAELARKPTPKTDKFMAEMRAKYVNHQDHC